MSICSYEPEDNSPPAFWTPLKNNDVLILRRWNYHRRFDISLVHAVAKRCSAGFPQVVVCRPVTSNGVPFPTLFWLTCPYLERKCGELESQQKINELEDVFRERIPEIIKWHKKYSQLRLSLLDKSEAAKIEAKNSAIWNILCTCGVGGINWKDVPFAAKCLHLQAATWLGWDHHPAADWLAAQLYPTECADKICINICG